jgi:hypothetical protein
MRMFRVALLTIVGLETTPIPISSRVDEQAVAMWSQDEILYSSQNKLHKYKTICVHCSSMILYEQA